MAAGTIRVRGLKELQRDFRKMGGDLPKELRSELKEAGGIVADEARARFSDISAYSASGYRPVVRARGVSVDQTRRRTSGLRPDFGRLQMLRALIPALESKTNEVVNRLERMLDKIANRNGF